jgi:hypothetical protein
MTQKFNPAIPQFKASLESKEIRDQLNSLDSCHAGTTSPPYATEGKFWFKTDDFAIYQYMFGDWRLLFRFNPSTLELEVANGTVMAKNDYKAGVEPTGDKNGVNDTYTTPEKYFLGTLSVFLNGQQYDASNITQNGPGYTTFTIVGDTLPESGDALTVTYLKG